MGIFTETIERQNGTNTFELTMEEAIKAAKIEKEKDREAELQRIRKRIYEVENQMVQEGREVHLQELWGKYLYLRGEA